MDLKVLVVLALIMCAMELVVVSHLLVVVLAVQVFMDNHVTVIVQTQCMQARGVLLHGVIQIMMIVVVPLAVTFILWHVMQEVLDYVFAIGMCTKNFF